MKTYYDTQTSQFNTQEGLRQRGLPASDAILAQAGIYPVRYMYPAYDARLYAIEPKAVAVEDGIAWQEFDVVPMPVESAKNALLELVQKEKVRVRDGGFDIDGVHYDSDLPARMSYNELAIRLQQDPEYTTPWKASEGQWVTMDATLYASVVTHGEAHMTAVFTWQAQKEAQINACTTIEELEAVSATYGE